MGLIRGQRHLGNFTPDVKDREIQSDILMKQPDRAPFTSLLMALPDKATFAAKFEHAEDDTLVSTIQVNGAHLIGDTTIQLDTDHAKRCRLNMQVFNKTTKEVMVITDIDLATDIITVVKGAASSTAAAIADNEVLILSSEAQEEGVTFVDAITNELDLSYNYIQEVETPIEASWLQMATQELTTPDWKHQTNKAILEHKEKLERIYWLGKRDLRTGPNGKRVYYTGGIFWFIEADTTNANWKKDFAGGPLTKSGIDDWMRHPLTYGSPSRKALFTSPYGRMKLTQISEGFQRVARSESTLGMEITKVSLNGKVLPIIENQMFAKVGMEDYIFLVDLDMVGLRYLSANGKSFKTRWYPNQQVVGTKGQKDVLYSVQGLQIKNVLAHGYAKGFA